ncbi:MAG: hypothetical protein IT330_14160, partial [Anaerolineae bacterium]|nr:hypothetical protein [Anaerolineae bacterium]
MLLAPRLQRLNAVTLTPFVRLVLGDDTAEVIRWNYETLGGSWERTGDLISRLKGAAVSDGHERSWSVILKIPGPIRPVIDVWQREPLLYGSGLLEKLLPPIRVPRCFGIEEPPGDEPWIWLEDVAGIPSVEWPMERFYRALRHLGECQGAWLCGARGPDYDWFNTGWWLRRDAIEA